MPPILQNRKPGNSFIYLIVLALLIAAGFIILSPGSSNVKKITLDQFVQQAKSGEIAKVVVKENKLTITRLDDSQEYTYKEGGQTLADILKDVPEQMKKDIVTDIQPPDSQDFWLGLLGTLLPTLLIVGILIFIMRQAQNSNNQAMSFGKSRARLFDKEKQKTTFADVAGAKEAKEELVEIVDFLKTPTKYTSMGAKIPKGVLLIGPPGTGKNASCPGGSR